MFSLRRHKGCPGFKCKFLLRCFKILGVTFVHLSRLNFRPSMLTVEAVNCFNSYCNNYRQTMRDNNSNVLKPLYWGQILLCNCDIDWRKFASFSSTESFLRTRVKLFTEVNKCSKLPVTVIDGSSKFITLEMQSDKM